MKILHVIPELLVAFGGPPWTLAALAKAQAERGDDVIVLSTRRATSPTTLPLGKNGNLTVLEVQTDSSGKWPDQEVLKTLRKLVQDRDIVHVHGTWRYHFRAAAKACKEVGVPYIVRPAGNLGLVTRRHKWYFKQPYYWLVEKRLFNQAAAIHCTSTMELEELRGLAIRSRKFVLRNAVPLAVPTKSSDITSLQQWCPQIRPEDKLIINVGRISWKKNLDVLVEAFTHIHRDFPDWRLILAGPHEEPSIVERLQQQASQHGIANRVLLPGVVNGDAKTALFSRAELFAQSSVHENFGVSVAEAMLFGVPCVLSTGIAIAPDVVSAGAGFACISSPEPFAQILRTLMENEALRLRCKQHAKALALHKEYERCLSSTHHQR